MKNFPELDMEHPGKLIGKPVWERLGHYKPDSNKCEDCGRDTEGEIEFYYLSCVGFALDIRIMTCAELKPTGEENTYKSLDYFGQGGFKQVKNWEWGNRFFMTKETGEAKCKEMNYKLLSEAANDPKDLTQQGDELLGGE